MTVIWGPGGNGLQPRNGQSRRMPGVRGGMMDLLGEAWEGQLEEAWGERGELSQLRRLRC